MFQYFNTTLQRNIMFAILPLRLNTCIVTILRHKGLSNIPYKLRWLWKRCMTTDENNGGNAACRKRLVYLYRWHCFSQFVSWYTIPCRLNDSRCTAAIIWKLHLVMFNSPEYNDKLSECNAVSESRKTLEHGSEWVGVRIQAHVATQEKAESYHHDPI